MNTKLQAARIKWELALQNYAENRFTYAELLKAESEYNSLTRIYPTEQSRRDGQMLIHGALLGSLIGAVTLLAASRRRCEPLSILQNIRTQA